MAIFCVSGIFVNYYSLGNFFMGHFYKARKEGFVEKVNIQS